MPINQLTGGLYDPQRWAASLQGSLPEGEQKDPLFSTTGTTGTTSTTGTVAGGLYDPQRWASSLEGSFPEGEQKDPTLFQPGNVATTVPMRGIILPEFPIGEQKPSSVFGDVTAGTAGGTSGDFDLDTVEGIDQAIAQLEGQIATSMQAGGGSPDYSAFYQSPGYQFRMDEGTRAIERSAAAKGKLMSGGLLRELTRYGQGLASSEFNSYANRLASMAGIGQTATQYTGQLGASAAGQYGATSGQLGQTIMSGGQAQASGYIGSSNALMQGYTGAIDALWDDDEDGGGTRGWQSQPYSGTAYNWY